VVGGATDVREARCERSSVQQRMGRPMTELVASSATLVADARSVGSARRLLQDAMSRSGADKDKHIDAAVLVLSEIVTNALVHAGTDVTVRVWSGSAGTRVEVEDGGTHLPVRRRYARTAGTGRGLQLVDELADRWGVHRRTSGKSVWFEVGQVSGDFDDAQSSDEPDRAATGGDDAVRAVTLRRAPLLMHWAWQEHAAALLREYLLHVLDRDATVLDQHAEASAAMSLLSEQLPVPDLPDQRDALMVGALEPQVTADEVVLKIPAEAVSSFATLDDLLRRAIREARAGRFLGPPTQPEIDEMRAWLCAEVARQSSGQATATPWLARTDVRATLADQASLTATYARLAAVDEPLLATDEASIIVAASAPALRVLGYDSSDDLVGRRVLVVVPARYHQAHIAGTTLNATHGRDNLLGVPLVVPMVRADGTEVAVHIEVSPERVDEDHRVFVARFSPA
jgi:PAS domain S-box-containing protein